jgi:flagellar hook protein FlgE
MAAQAGRLATVADNIANVNTNGYKRASTEFSSLLIQSSAVFRLYVRFGDDGYRHRSVSRAACKARPR